MAKNSIYDQSPFVSLDSTDENSITQYKENKPSKFKNILPSELKLDGQGWEVGLVYGRFPFTFRSVKTAQQFGLVIHPASRLVTDEFTTRKLWQHSGDNFIRRINSTEDMGFP